MFLFIIITYSAHKKKIKTRSLHNYNHITQFNTYHNYNKCSYAELPNTQTNNIYCFKHVNIFKTVKMIPTPNFYKRYSGLPMINSIHMLLYYGCDRLFRFLLSRMFWNTKITNHRYILLWLRRLLKLIWLNKDYFNISGINFITRGKLSVTGNKRRRSFKVNYGSYNSTKMIPKVSYFTIRTLTGVLGITLAITYNH